MFNTELKNKIKELEARIKVLEEANIMAGVCVGTLTDVVKKLHDETLDKVAELTNRVNHIELKGSKNAHKRRSRKVNS